MYQLKGFVDIKPLASNVPFVTAPIGELSSHAQTYARDRGIYNSLGDKSLSIISFLSSSSVNGNVTVPQPILTKAFEVVEWVYSQQSIASASMSRSDFLNNYNNQFNSTCDSLACGEMVSDITGHPFPEWINFSFRAYTAESNSVKLWFSDNSFRHQYDNSEILVVPPIPNIDQFFQNATNVRNTLASVSYASIIEQISTTRQESPETLLSAETYYWVNPLNSSDKIATNWTVLIYGAMGNDADLIKNAIVDYVTAHSTHSTDEWKVIFPDIFKRTEFIVVPKWHKYAVENMSLQAGIYSPIVNATNEINYIKSMLPSYPAAHISAHLTFTVSPYRCLALDIIGSNENRDNLFELTQMFPDMMSISSTSADFNRMSLDTQGFLNLLDNLIQLAENMTQYSDIPVGYRRAKRDNILYATASYKNVQYMVASKATTPQ